jgi:hypothetical protein
VVTLANSLGIFVHANTADRTYTFPNASGTVALLTDIHAPVTLGTANGLSLSTQTLSLGLASSGVTGALSGTDWDTFNGKQAALNGTGLVRMAGTTVSYDNSTYLTGTKVDSFNSRTGVVTLTSSDVTTALNYTPYQQNTALSATTGIFSTYLTTPYNNLSTIGSLGISSTANPENGLMSLWYAAISAGKPIYTDEEFAVGLNGVVAYNNSGGTPIIITRVADSQAPNRTGYKLTIAYDGSAVSPGLGGFYLIITSLPNRTYVQRFRAKVPVGYSLALAENAQGTNNNSYWLTPTAGTGKWEEYIRVSHCGNTGTFSSGGHVYLNGPAGAVTWYLASCNVYEIQTSGIADILQNGLTTLGPLSTTTGTFSTSNLIPTQNIDTLNTSSDYMGFGLTGTLPYASSEWFGIKEWTNGSDIRGQLLFDFYQRNALWVRNSSSSGTSWGTWDRLVSASFLANTGLPIGGTTGSFTTITGTSFNSITGLASVAPLMDGTVAVGTSTLTARQDHIHPTDTTRATDSLVVHLAGPETITGVKSFNTSDFGAGTFLNGLSTQAYPLGPTARVNGIVSFAICDANGIPTTWLAGSDIRASAQHVTGTLAAAYGVKFTTQVTQTGTVTDGYGVYGQVGMYGANVGNYTRGYGAYLVVDKGSGTIGTSYGLYIATSNGTISYGIYAPGGADNYFAGTIHSGAITSTAGLSGTTGRFSDVTDINLTTLAQGSIQTSGGLSVAKSLTVGGNVIIVGTQAAASGFGGNLRYRDDTGTVRWLTGLKGTAAATSYIITDIVNSGDRLTIDSAGAATFSNTITATQFIGSGAGLTGTASSLTVGTATSIIVSTLSTGTRYVPGSSAISGTATSLEAVSSIYFSAAGVMTASDFSASSDERLKEDWQDLPIDFISQLSKVKVGTYHRIDNNLMSIGASAQSLQNIMPLAVHEGENKMLSISYGNAALVSAVELAKEVEKLKARIIELEARVA